MKKYIAIVHEKGQYDDIVKYEFDSFDERKWFLVSMRGVLICTEAYTEQKNKQQKMNGGFENENH